MFNSDLYNEAFKVISKKYLLASMVAMRVRQLQQGADPLVEPEDLHPIDIALKEIAEGMIEPRKEEIAAGIDIFGGQTLDQDEETEETGETEEE